MMPLSAVSLSLGLLLLCYHHSMYSPVLTQLPFSTPGSPGFLAELQPPQSDSVLLTIPAVLGPRRWQCPPWKVPQHPDPAFWQWQGGQPCPRQRAQSQVQMPRPSCSRASSHARCCNFLKMAPTPNLNSQNYSTEEWHHHHQQQFHQESLGCPPPEYPCRQAVT